MLFEVVPEMTDQEASLRHAQWAMQTGNQIGYTLAANELGQLLAKDPDYYPALIQNAMRLRAVGKPEEYQPAAKIVYDKLAQANTLTLEDRVELAVVLINSDHNAEAIQQAAAALAMPATDEKALRHLQPERLTALLQLAANAPAGSYPVKTFDLGVSLLPSAQRAQVIAEQAAVTIPTDPAKAVELYHDALKASPEYYPALSALSLLLSTGKDAAIRNSTEALDLATRAANAAHVQDAENLELLAYANAEAGKWDDAIYYAKMAATFLQNNGKQADELAKWTQRMQLFQNHQPYHSS
jgi:tetratricopeptide (TPR) repeat protein